MDILERRKKKLLVISDSFKGSLSSQEICDIWQQVNHEMKQPVECTCIPFADGGEGSLSCYAQAGKSFHTMQTVDANQRTLIAPYLVDHEVMLIETAAIIGLPLMQGCLQPMKLNTRGIGLMILNGIEQGFRKFLLFLGGSATIDGGIGMAEALGYHFYDKQQQRLQAIPENIAKIAAIDTQHIHPMLSECTFILAADVDNPLVGSTGCVQVFGKQKGASSYQMTELEYGLLHLTKMIEGITHLSIKKTPGLGAAGGMGLFLYGFHHAVIKNGTQLLMEHLRLDEELAKTDVIISGEGHLDEQSLHGKMISYVMKKAKSYQIPIILIVGRSDFINDQALVDRIVSISSGSLPLKEEINNARANYYRCCTELLYELTQQEQQERQCISKD